MKDYQKRDSSFAEYIALREELLQRIGAINNYTINSLTIIIALWVAGFSLVGVRFGIRLDSKAYINMAFTFGESVAFFMVLPIVESFVIKNEENVRQIASLGAYLRVFYECIPIVKENETYFCWESLDSSLNLLKTDNIENKQKRNRLMELIFSREGFARMFYNLEYIAAAITSTVLFLISLISFFTSGLSSVDYTNWSEFFLPNILFIISILAYLAFVVVVLLSILSIFKHNASSLFWRYYIESMKMCVRYARRIGCIDDDEEKKINEMVLNTSP